MIDAYRSFFTASVGASAAFIGLLFVAVSFIDSEKVDEVTQNWRRIIANSSFSQLVNIFFISLSGLLPDPHNLAVVGIVMGSLGVLIAFVLLPKTIQQEKTGHTRPTQLGLVATAASIVELVVSIGLLHNPKNQSLLNWLIVVIIFLYAGALARAWEITGIRKR